jgi:hypothetical protein
VAAPEHGLAGAANSLTDVRQQRAALAEQLLQWTRQEQQQRRWQQLQQQLKTMSAAGGSRAVRQQELQQSLQQLQSLVDRGDFAEVEAAVEDLQPGLLNDVPAVKFEIKRCLFVEVRCQQWCEGAQFDAGSADGQLLVDAGRSGGCQLLCVQLVVCQQIIDDGGFGDDGWDFLLACIKSMIQA